MKKKYLYIIAFVATILIIIMATSAAVSYSNKNSGNGSVILLPTASDLKRFAKAPLTLPIPAIKSGHVLNLTALAKHRPIVINFFASWCPLCVSELGALAKADVKYHKRVLFIGIDTDDQNPALAKKYLASAGATYQVGVDFFSTRITNAWGLSNGLPATFFIDKSGRIEQDVLGAESLPVLESRVSQLLRNG